MAIWLAPPHPTHKNARARQESACPSVLGGTDRVGAAQHPKPLIQKSRVAGHMPRTFFALRFASAPSFEATSKPPTTVVPSTLSYGWHHSIAFLWRPPKASTSERVFVTEPCFAFSPLADRLLEPNVPPLPTILSYQQHTIHLFLREVTPHTQLQ